MQMKTTFVESITVARQKKAIVRVRVEYYVTTPFRLSEILNLHLWQRTGGLVADFQLDPVVSTGQK